LNDDKKSVLLVSVNTFYGGGDAHLVNLADLLAADCKLSALVFDPTLARNLRERGIKVHQLSLLPASARALQVFHAMLVLPFILLSARIQVVQVTGSFETLLLPVARLLGSRTISIRHLVPFPGSGTWLSWLRRLFIEVVYGIGTLFANEVVCVSETIALALQERTYKRPRRVIRNWVSSIPPYRSLSGHSGPVRLLFVGRLESHKGLHLLLHALKPLSGYELTVVGDGSGAEELKHLAAGMNVRFEGFQREVSRYYRQADVFVMPSLGPEGLPLVTIEAMSHGLACLLSDLPVHCEVSRAGQVAILFESGNIESLRRQLQPLLQSESERERFGLAAYREVLASYNPEQARIAYLDTFGIVPVPTESGVLSRV
jgi:glycosyltransferase involved in cell wall biosynthesis